MGIFQSGINNILGQAATVTSKVKAYSDKKAEIKAKEAEDIASANKKLDTAELMAVGYSETQAAAKLNQRAMGLEEYSKKPRGVQQKAFDRRMANLQAMQEIRQKWSQNKDFRDRINKSSSSQLAATLKPTIDKKESKK